MGYLFSGGFSVLVLSVFCHRPVVVEENSGNDPLGTGFSWPPSTRNTVGGTLCPWKWNVREILSLVFVMTTPLTTPRTTSSVSTLVSGVSLSQGDSSPDLTGVMDGQIPSSWTLNYGLFSQSDDTWGFHNFVWSREQVIKTIHQYGLLWISWMTKSFKSKTRFFVLFLHLVPDPQNFPEISRSPPSLGGLSERKLDDQPQTGLDANPANRGTGHPSPVPC
jgi:hypothetical protein